MPIPVIVVIVAFVLALTVWQRLKLKQGMAQHRDKGFGEFSQRLGLAVEAGDPTTHLLYFQQPAGNYRRELRAVGRPYGRPVKLAIMDGVKSSEFIIVRTVTHSFGCFLDAKLAHPVAAFEVALRNPNQYLVPELAFAERTDLHEVPTGQPLIDATFIVRTSDPRIAPALVPALEVLSPQLFVHLAAEGDTIWMSFTRMALPYFAGAGEDYLLALESAACALEGRPVPARIAAPASATA